MGFVESRGRTWDTLTELNTWVSKQITDSGGLDTAYAALTYDTGGGRTKGDFIVHVATLATINIAGYNLRWVLQGSNTAAAAFTSYVPLAMVALGDTGASSYAPHFVSQDSPNSTAGGWYVRPFDNDYGGVLYRYLRCYFYTGGTPQAGTIYRAYISKDAG